MKLTDWAITHVQLTDRMLVDQNRRRWMCLLTVDLVAFVASVVAFATWPLWYGTWWGFVASMIIGVQLGRASIVTLRRAGAYRSGWLRGRSAMVIALSEAGRRGMTPNEWLEGELQRDWAVLGIDPLDLEGDDADS